MKFFGFWFLVFGFCFFGLRFADPNFIGTKFQLRRYNGDVKKKEPS